MYSNIIENSYYKVSIRSFLEQTTTFQLPSIRLRIRFPEVFSNRMITPQRLSCTIICVPPQKRMFGASLVHNKHLDLNTWWLLLGSEYFYIRNCF